MANSVKIINYLQPQGEFLTFYTELNSNLKVDDKVFIVGGNYDNVKYTDKTNSEYDPFNDFATGYKVISVDNTDNSNAITLNIKFGLSQFNLTGINTSIFNPKPVYKTEEELLITPNQIREAYISKSYFKRGEFNGGNFDDGMFGEYNIQGKTSDKIYEREKFVKLLEETNNLNLTFDYSTLTEPALNNKAKFNNKFTSDSPSKFNNGIFLGGEFQWGEWKNKFDINTIGKKQTLNDLDLPFDPLNNSKFNITKFSNNNDGFGYSTLVSGNIGKVYEENHNVKFVYNGTNSYIELLDFLPYPIKKSLESNFKFNIQIKINSNKNNKIFDVLRFDILNKRIYITPFVNYLKSNNIDYQVEQLIFNEEGIFLLELYIKDNLNGIRNTIDTATILNPDIFSGLIDNTWMQGGDIWGGEFKKGRYSSKYSRLNFRDGVFNGTKEQSFAEDLRWYNGLWLDGNWKGDINISIKNFSINNVNNTSDSNIFYIDIQSKYKHILQIGDDVFISYFKKSIGNSYFQNFTDIPTEYPLNFTTFQLVDIIETSDLNNLKQVRLELRGAVDLFKEDVSLQYAKISQSYFNKGIWNDGIWNSGLRKITNKHIEQVLYTPSINNNYEIEFQLNSIDGLYLGEKVESSNLEIVRKIEVGIIDGTDNINNFKDDDRGTSGSKVITFIEPFNSTLTIIDINSTSGIIKLKFPILDKLELDKELEIKDDYQILDIRKKLINNDKSELTEAIWVNGEFKSGVWDGGIFRNGSFKSNLYFDNINTEIQAIWKSGYWKSGIFENSAYLSGIFENGTINSGVITNLFNNNDNNSEILWNNGDTVFVDGTINDVEWRRGLMLKSDFNKGEIINGGIENVRFNSGKYTNGLGEFDNSINTNRSGRQLDDKKWIDLSAPSFIYIDGEGWVQLDQPSFYQKDYNIIFKDLDRFPNPLNGEMFDILNRDKYGTKIKINYSTSGDNPLYLTDDFKLMKPILAIDNLKDFTQIDEFIYWIADSGNNRILILDTKNKKVEVLGKIILETDIWNFSNIKFISTPTKFSNLDNLQFVYVVDIINNIDTLRRISLDVNNNPVSISNYINILNLNETIIDLKSIVKGGVEETVICLTSNNRLLYTSTKTNILKSLSLDGFITNSISINPLRKLNTNSLDLLILNNNTISHLILDYNTTNDVYLVRTTSPIIINGLEFISTNIITFTSKYLGNGINIFIILENTDKNADIYSFFYNDFFTGETNSFILLNDINIEFPIFRTKISQFNENLTSILLHRGEPLILSNSDLVKTTTGFGDPISQIRLFDINSSDSTSGYSYWLYDDITDRLIYVNESLLNQYDPNNDVDSLKDASNRYVITKMTKGETKTIVYSIQFNIINNTYSIRKTERGKIDNLNSTIFTLNNVSHIYDIVYNDKLFILLKTILGEYKIVELNQTLLNSNVDVLNYFSSDIGLSSIINYSKASLDIIKKGTSYIGVISASTDSFTNVNELRINSTTITSYNIYTNLSYIVNDVLISFEESINYIGLGLGIVDFYSLFFATNSGVYKVFSDKLYTLPPIKYRWSEFGTNLYYMKDNIKEIYLDKDNNKIISSFGENFSIFDRYYITINNQIEENDELTSLIIFNNDVIGLSHNRLIKVNSGTSSVLEAQLNIGEKFKIGRYDQDSRIGFTSNTQDIVANSNFILNRPKSLTINSTNGLYFIDDIYNNGQLKQVIRTYKLNSNITPNYGLILNTSPILINYINDLSYYENSGTNSVYYSIYDGTNSEFWRFNINSINTQINTNVSILGNVNKFSVNKIGTDIYYIVLKSDNTIYYGKNTGSFTQINNIEVLLPNIQDISLINDGINIILYILQNNKLFYITYNSGFSSDTLINIQTSFDIGCINENINSSELIYFDKTNYKTNKISLNPNSRNENLVKIDYFGFNPSINNPDIIFLYNNPLVGNKGVIKQNYNLNLVDFTPQLNNISTGIFKKLISIDENIVYSLFDEGTNGLKVYKYDFTINTVSVLNNPIPQYRNNTQNPASLSNFTLNPVDITHYNGKLLTLFRYYELNIPSDYYDVFVLTNNNFDKTDITWIYERDINNNPLPINNHGSTSGLSYPIGGNLLFLFHSNIAPKIYSGFKDLENYISLYFGETNQGNFIKLTRTNIINTLVSNVYNDLIIKATIPSFYNTAETINYVELLPNPETNNGNIFASTFGISSITIGTNVISLNNNEIWAKFNSTSSFININSNFILKVSTNLFSNHISSTSFNTGIPEFRIFEKNGNNIIINENISVIGTNTPIDTIYGNNRFYEMKHSGTGFWELYEVIDLNYNVYNLLRSFYAPVLPTTNKSFNLINITTNNNNKQFILDILNFLDNQYKFNNITKGYKVSDDNININQKLSPYITSRILYKTLLNSNVQFNNLGTPKTAHFVSSKWNNGLFLGTWDEPSYFNNKLISDFSIFVNGIFEGDFYDGFFLGGEFRNNINQNSNLLQGHFLSDNKNINISSGNIQSKYRYDILNMNWNNNILYLTTEGLFLDGDDYKNTPISKIGKNTWVRIPNLFNKLEFTIEEIWNSKIKVDGKNEITILINIPTFLDATLNSNILEFLNREELFIEAFEFSEDLFGVSKIQNIFKKDNIIYITINSNFNHFNETGKYIPVNKPKILFNEFVKITSSNTYIKNEKSYSTFTIDLFSPLTTQLDNLKFIEKIYFKDYIEVIKTGNYIGYIQIPNYLQIFNTSLSKTGNKFKANFNSALENLYLQDIISTSFDDDSKIIVDLQNSISKTIAHDIISINSDIEASPLRTIDYVENSIFLSGKLLSNLRTGSWLSIDDKGFSHGKSQLGSLDRLSTFNGDFTKIIDFYFEGNEFIWIQLENILFNVDKYRWITLRGFSGNKSQLIGSTRSKVFRIEEVSNNLIKIRNPFLYYDFNKDLLTIQKQSMYIKGLEGINIKCSTSDQKQLFNNQFLTSISNQQISNNWYYKSIDIGSTYNTNSGTHGIKSLFTITGKENYKPIYQNYEFKINVNYNFEIKYEVKNITNSIVNIEVYMDGSLIKKQVITIIGITSNSFNFNWIQFEDSTSELSIKITGSNNTDNSNNVYGIVKEITILNSPKDDLFEFYYGWASVSTFNGGDFYGDFNSIWNAGNFKSGNFNGLWFGSEENRAWNGNVFVETIPFNNRYLTTVYLDKQNKLIDNKIEIIGGASVQLGDLIFLEFNSIFNNETIINTFGGHYGVVINSTSGLGKIFQFESNDVIPNDRYSINITKYRKDYLNSNTLITDFNSNLKINDNYNSYDIMDWNLNSGLTSGTNSVLLFDGETYINTIDYINIANTENDKGFSIDLLFNLDSSTEIQPILSFQNSKLGLGGIKLYYRTGKLFLKIRTTSFSESEFLIPTTYTSINSGNWYHILINFDTIINSQVTKIGDPSQGLLNITTNNIDFVNYDISYIGKILNLESDKSISEFTLTGKLDEIRIWNKVLSQLNTNIDNTLMNKFLFTGNKLNKFTNQYIPELTAYYNADKIKTLDNTSYFPEEETYFVLKGNNTIVLQDELSGTNFIYSKNNVFLEFDFFPEQYSDINDTRGEYKLFTLEETRDLTSITPEFTKYYLEFILKEVNKNFFYFIIREKVTKNPTLTQFNELIYPVFGNFIDYTKDFVFSDITNFKEFYNWYNLILTDNEIYLNGIKIGDYNLSNRNLFKYTVDTKIILGEYEFAKIQGNKIEKTKGLKGFIKNINLWENKKFKDEYSVFRILSGENTDLYNTSNILNSNILLESGSNNQIIIPNFNSDGSNKWETFIYSGESNYTKPDIKPSDLNVNYLSTSLPISTWFEGTDFKIITTNQNVINNNVNSINNNNYLLTKEISGTNNTLILSNMSNFKFFDKKISDKDGKAKLNVSANGYLFFEDLITGSNTDYPLFKYTDNISDIHYKQTSTTDAIMFMNTIDIRSYKGGFVKYADRKDEFVIEFFGRSTIFEEINTILGKKETYKEINQTTNINNELFSFYAIRIDKINSNITFYIRRNDISSDQKILGLRRSDGYWSYINDTSGLINYYKQPSDKDFVVGFNSSNTNIKSSNDTEYITFVPRFNVQNSTNGFVDYISNKDYDFLKENFGVNVLKQFNGNLLNQYKIITDTNLSLTKFNLVYMLKYPSFENFLTNNFVNTKYDLSEQYKINSTSFLFNGINDETQNLVSRASFFYNGNFNSKIWYNGIFVNGNINSNNFIWKYGIKHNGTLQGGNDLKNYATWLGGYHLGNTDNSFVKNLVWLRGIFDGGVWEKGHWLAEDLNLKYENDLSIFRGGEWYSRVDDVNITSIGNLFVDGNNGTFGGNVSNWNLNIKPNISVVSSNIPSMVNIKAANPTVSSSSGSYANQISVFNGASQILVKRNTIYTVNAKVYISNSASNNGGVKISAIGDKNINNIINVSYRRNSINNYFYTIQENSNNKYDLVAETQILANVKHTFNTGDNDFIYIDVESYQNISGFKFYISNIEIIGEKLNIQDFNPYLIQNHDSIWHGGIWESKLLETGIIDEFGNPIFFKHTWEAPETKLYKIKNEQILTLNKVQSIWLGGLWLRGDFKGGIFSNGFWHSVKCQNSTSGFEYEKSIEQVYNSTSSVFYNGKMINSIWYGGTVNNQEDKLDVVFGDLTNLNSDLINSNDFVWKHSEFKFKKSDFSKAYSSQILGRETFTGFHYDLFNDNTEKRLEEIEKLRVRKQYNSDGIMGVYWKRGEFDNGLFQFSHFDSLDLNNQRQKYISEKENKNYSIFRKGIIYSSLWKNGLFYGNSTREIYPFLDTEEPNSLFYYSHWEKGYWKSKGLKNVQILDIHGNNISSLDTTDNIQISNSLFSRSLWDAGVFEGGIMDLSIWRSGVFDNNIILEYKNSSINLINSTNNNLAFFVDNKAGTNTDFEFSTNGLSGGFNFILNGTDFINNIKNTKYRWLGSVDNLSSIFVNGHMRGTIWHGGIWQRGMFQHKDLVDVDFFNRNLITNFSLPKFQLGIWNRGLWLSGYFSFYDDKILDKKNIIPSNLDSTKNTYLAYNGDINQGAGRRSLFMAVDAENITDNGNIIGMNTISFNSLLTNIRNNVNDKNNFASFFMRRILKERTHRDPSIIYPNKKPYFSVMNGTMLNGVLYQELQFTDFNSNYDRYILSLHSTVSDSFNLTSYDNTIRVSENNINYKNYFNFEIPYSNSTIDTFIIPYSDMIPLTWDGSWAFIKDNSDTFNQSYLANYNNGNPNYATPFPHVWRHNYDERTNFGAKFGDGTIVNGTNGLRATINPFNSNSNVQISIAQGAGLKFIQDEPNGEPKYNGNEYELKYHIISFESNIILPGQGFDGTNFETS